MKRTISTCIIALGTFLLANAANGIGDYKPYTPDNVRFKVPVNCHRACTDADTTSLQDSMEMYYDIGVLMLPETYKPDGKPTRLVIACHGAGGGTTDTDSQTERMEYNQYLVANGYAVMDMNGLPREYADKYGVSYINNIGSPIAVEAYIKGYQWVIANYNIARDGVMVTGGSMGGISSTNLVMSGAIPILAHGVSCPVLDTYNHIWLHPWSGGLPKTAMQIIYGMGDTYDESKLCGYNPIVSGMVTFNSNGERIPSTGETPEPTSVTEYKHYPCALKIWHCDDDNTVSQAVSIRQVNAIRNAGGRAWLRRFPMGGHEPTTVGEYISHPSGNTNYKGTTICVKPFAEELLLFFNRYNQP